MRLPDPLYGIRLQSRDRLRPFRIESQGVQDEEEESAKQKLVKTAQISSVKIVHTGKMSFSTDRESWTALLNSCLA